MGWVHSWATKSGYDAIFSLGFPALFPTHIDTACKGPPDTAAHQGVVFLNLLLWHLNDQAVQSVCDL